MIMMIYMVTIRTDLITSYHNGMMMMAMLTTGFEKVKILYMKGSRYYQKLNTLYMGENLTISRNFYRISVR